MFIGILDIWQLSASVISLKLEADSPPRPFSLSVPSLSLSSSIRWGRSHRILKNWISESTAALTFFFFFKIMTKLIWKKEEKKLSLAMERSEVHRRGKYDMLEEWGEFPSVPAGLRCSVGLNLLLRGERRFCDVCLSHRSPRCDTGIKDLSVSNLFWCVMATEFLFESSLLCRRIQWNAATVEISWWVKKQKKKTGRWGIFFFLKKLM